MSDPGDEPSESSNDRTLNILDDDSNNESRVAKPLTQEDKQIVESANEILNSLEHVHRTDLTLHLYSSFLLKKLLYKANEKKHFYAVNNFIKTQLKDSWVSWPNPNTIIDPQTDKIYEDMELMNNKISTQEPINIAPNEVSAKALRHAINMLDLELSGQWQHLLAQSSKISGLQLDVDKTIIPNDISSAIFDKLDHFFLGLHHKVAKQNKITVSRSKQVTPEMDENQTVVQIQNKTTNVNKHIKLTYHDIIERGCQMGENMEEIYMKSLELFNDVPNTFKKHEFKLPKKILKTYRYKRKIGKKPLPKFLFSKSEDDYFSLEAVASNAAIPWEDREYLRDINRKETEMGLNKKNFFQVKGYKATNDGLIENLNSNNSSILPNYPKRKKSLVNKAWQPDVDDSDVYDMDDYTVDLNNLP
ncbi:similar to Saccharomyces cerevisiae YMR270C RRN9 Protein involved in promoting high level transcription of rDNA, subunit of UAF (upstream activation factor) for RNA polymerase I [Maudiozyma saulgeensis]|uniref:Similar to Saccharomyces cerevisiae YMR270C RRN9 Protein involved in promoting high level transcription of rDNA, subunit of UAF (Upstream activation factor) for RNA polymerase I n=1 Tax=Maudiozyma saulgeensis TaxID=1789683 RepID=A0A1X7R8N6_9SACH|nr:similar to Saccharomyces cerevisiae YMR270C RRN9 Protein involved in promoting high level transcription of rDNA, subunit of UAF (upstream activation factor) for RNA polymerase I [Kazachstania saulgeensis]